MLMPFGKYRGVEVRTLPFSYLRWLHSISLSGTLREEVGELLGWPDPTPPITKEERLKKKWHQAEEDEIAWRQKNT